MLMEKPQLRPNIYQVVREVSLMRGIEVPIKDVRMLPVPESHCLLTFSDLFWQNSIRCKERPTIAFTSARAPSYFPAYHWGIPLFPNATAADNPRHSSDASRETCHGITTTLQC